MPVFSAGNEKRPPAFVTALVVTPVALCFATTSAPGMTPPLVSTTTPASTEVEPARVRPRRLKGDETMIRKLSSGKYRLYSRKRDPKTGRRRNLGTFSSRPAAERHERAVQFFKRR